MIRPLEKSVLTDFIARKDEDSVRTALKPYHPFDIANLIPELAPDHQVAVLLALPAKRQAQVFGYLDAEEQMTIVRALSREELGRLFADMDPDERADLNKRLPEAVREAILPGLAAAEREDVRKLAAYREGTVGSVMTSAYATLPADITVARRSRGFAARHRTARPSTTPMSSTTRAAWSAWCRCATC